MDLVAGVEKRGWSWRESFTPASTSSDRSKLKPMKIRIHRWMGIWHFSDNADPIGRKIQASQGYHSYTEATAAALDWAKESHTTIEALTGHADKHLARKANVPFRDERGNRRRGKTSATRSNLRNLKQLLDWGRISQAEYEAGVARERKDNAL